MRTELQRQTSRLNGAKSRGPRTAAGKARSSQNACRHGLYSRRILSEEVRQTLKLPLPSEPLPESLTPAEMDYRLADREFMHVTALETRIFTEEIERQRALHPEESGDSLLARAWRHFSHETGIMEALFRLQSAASRHLEEAAWRLKQEWAQSDIERTAGRRCAQSNNAATNAATALHPGEPCAHLQIRGTNPTVSPDAPSNPCNRHTGCATPVAKNEFRGTNPAPSGAPAVSASRATRHACHPRSRNSVAGARRRAHSQNRGTNPAPGCASALSIFPERGPPGPTPSGVQNFRR